MEDKKEVENDSKYKVETSYNVDVTRVEKPNSFECGKAGMRHKIYYSEVEELVTRLVELVELGLLDENEIDVEKLKLKVNDEEKPEGNIK